MCHSLLIKANTHFSCVTVIIHIIHIIIFVIINIFTQVGGVLSSFFGTAPTLQRGGG